MPYELESNPPKVIIYNIDMSISHGERQ